MACEKEHLPLLGDTAQDPKPSLNSIAVPVDQYLIKYEWETLMTFVQVVNHGQPERKVNLIQCSTTQRAGQWEVIARFTDNRKLLPPVAILQCNDTGVTTSGDHP